jgi:1,4-alpha-glucan branching enzyme
MVVSHSLLTEEDIYLFRKGCHYTLYEKLGSHLICVNETEGTLFAVWAPNALKVSVIGDFNDWNPNAHPLYVRWDSSGIWEGFIPNIKKGSLYKYHIESKNDGSFEKGDPFAFRWENPPKTASVVWDLNYAWEEKRWLKQRNSMNSLQGPISIYEMHFASWKRVVEENERPLSYLEMSEVLPSYLKEMGFTHVEFLPMMEHPFFGSWGYQKVGYFAPSARYGAPQDFMSLIEALHEAEIGVILDWVPSHFPSDGHGLAYFDGTHLFEHQDPKKGLHPDWNSYIFNYNRNEVRSFLISSAHFWCDHFHIDGLRVDAVASMLYLDYSRKEGEWIPNVFGGNENLEAIDFIKELNRSLYHRFPYIQTIAEESTAWPMVSRPVYLGGLGFGMKWNMGWMHDTLMYFSKDPIYRKFHHNELLFSLMYAFSENFVLPLSHDEVVHEKGSLLKKMSGDDWQKFANLRLLYGYLYTHPGKKLLFMGSEIAPWEEWSHEKSLDWHLLADHHHEGIRLWIKDLNHFYKSEPALFEQDFSKEGFEWIDLADWEGSIIVYLRKSKNGSCVVTICNMTPMIRTNYRVGVPKSGVWCERLNSDSSLYGGSNVGNLGEIKAEAIPFHGRPFSISITLPPLAVLCFSNS